MTQHRHRLSSPFRVTALLVGVALTLSSCASTVVQIRPPYAPKVRPGDGVKITKKDGTLLSGRATYVDRAIVVIRTPRQTIAKSPVTKTKFATTIRWEDVRSIKIAGTLDSQGRFVSNEEIRVNRRTNRFRKLALNIGLLGATASFLTAVQFQDSVSPPSTDPSFDRHTQARWAFWSTWIGGTLASAFLGYRLGTHLDRKGALTRIERQREQFRKAMRDSVREIQARRAAAILAFPADSTLGQ